MYRQYLARRGFDIEMAISAGLPHVEFDEDAVAQAALNLLDNAVKYSGDSRKVSVRMWPADGQVIFEVEDQGIGIPRKEQDRLFQEFYRSEEGRGRGGYGIGLFLVRHIMDAHSGTVEVESQVGVGSRFRLIFPSHSFREGSPESGAPNTSRSTEEPDDDN
jgi:two-component system phosphate regulon sensor histidine kinase PhoR